MSNRENDIVVQAEEIAKDHQNMVNFAEDFSETGKELWGEDVSKEAVINYLTLVKEYEKEIERRGKWFPMEKDWKGRCTVICEESFDNECNFAGKFATPEEALGLVKKLEVREAERIMRYKKGREREALRDSLTGSGIATNSYYAYWPDGRRIIKNEKGEIMKPLPKPRRKNK
jgi:hypothetical protein